jgi:hypothetical protein
MISKETLITLEGYKKSRERKKVDWGMGVR